jgi:glycerol-3-phosphate cytidylyltransferase
MNLNKPITGFLAGGFDIIHPGYIEMFEDAKKYCDYLYIFLQTDPSIERPQKLKPTLSVEDRKKILLALRYVDEVLTYTTEDDLVELIKKVNPDVRILGTDYIGKSITGQNLPPKIIYTNREHHKWSQSEFKKMITQSVLNHPYSEMD